MPGQENATTSFTDAFRSPILDHPNSRASEILRICQKMTGERDLSSLVDIISTDVKHLVQADRVSIMLLDEKKHELRAVPTQGGPSIKFDARRGIAGYALHTGRVVNVQDAYRDPRFSQDVDRNTGYRTTSILASPLRNPKGEVIGVCEALNKKSGAFTRDDEQTLETFSSQAVNAIETACLIQQLQGTTTSERRFAAKQPDGEPPRTSIIGASQSLLSVLGRVRRYASSDITILITGETGTGKELVAHYIHDNSSRSGKPFVACNLASIPESLLESELFGYTKGAFTGAQQDKRGLLEEANTGTLFLDEVGDVPHNLQVKLLRLLEGREYYRVGESSPRTADVRIVAATNRELEEAIEANGFRRDLYYRLSGAQVMLPPLRDRLEDLLLLAESFTEEACTRMATAPKALSRPVIDFLLTYTWPGNIRELRNTIEGAVIVSESDQILMSDLPMHVQEYAELDRTPTKGGGQSSMKVVEKRLISSTLEECGSDKAVTAERLGISMRTLYRKLGKYGLTG
jgi:Nif-specific regulatory protein